mmetsp:Transcript_27897/g.85166  ORF Transcript_27897/g.85166 Transcript_27897/m.85166 type:complete len:201 (+) Transcript_27897:271-873(+)
MRSIRQEGMMRTQKMIFRLSTRVSTSSATSPHVSSSMQGSWRAAARGGRHCSELRKARLEKATSRRPHPTYRLHKLVKLQRQPNLFIAALLHRMKTFTNLPIQQHGSRQIIGRVITTTPHAISSLCAEPSTDCTVYPVPNGLASTSVAGWCSSVGLRLRFMRPTASQGTRASGTRRSLYQKATRTKSMQERLSCITGGAT